MKRFVIAALAAASILGGGAAVAAPFHAGGAHGSHGGGGVHLAPIGGGFHPGGGGFHPTGFRGGPGGFHNGWGGPHAGGGFHDWGYGAFLPRVWLSNFIGDFAYYDLAAPPADFEWVQDGPNALLVNLDTGQVVQVVPGAFA